MAYQDQFYTVGTVTVTNGSAAVTGVGTGWETALIVGGVFYAGGGAYPIQSVAGETELTLAIPYAGVDAAGIGYAIDRQRAAAISNIAMNDRLAQIIREISIGNIEDLNALELVAGKLLATNGAGHLALEDKAALPIGTATQAALNAKANLSGASFTGDVLANGANVRAQYPRVSSTAGQVNTAGTLQSRLTSTDMFTNLVLQETVGSYVQAVLHVSLGGSNQAFFTFRHNGAMSVPGAFTAGSKSFKIDHVKDPYNKYLVFMSTEAPKAGTEDWGTVRLLNGQAEVDLDLAANLMPGTFAALTQRAIVVSVNNLDGLTHVHAGRINDGKFTIFADDPTCNDEVAWLVKAERADPFIRSHPFCDPVSGLLIPEHEKED